MRFNTEKEMIAINQNGVWRDRTSGICFLSLQENGAFAVAFVNEPDTFYHFSQDQLIHDRCPEEVHCLQIVTSQAVYQGFRKVLMFSRAQMLKIYLKDGTCISVPIADAEIIVDPEKVHSTPEGILSYYREVSAHVKTGDQEEGKVGFLESQFHHLGSINYESALYAYLNGTCHSFSHQEPYFYPFDFNGSQEKAVAKAFTSKISIVEGPPGTGKTQTILNIISNAIIANERVAVCSNNNSALINVIDKLKERKQDYLCAMLGSNANIDAFFAESHPLPGFFLPACPCSPERYESALEAKAILGKLAVEEVGEREGLSQLEKEFDFYQKNHPSASTLFEKGGPFARDFVGKHADWLLSLMVELESQSRDRFSFFSALHYFFREHFSLRLLKAGPLQVYQLAQYRYYQDAIRKKQAALASLEARIKSVQEQDSAELIHSYSVWALTHRLEQRFVRGISYDFTKENYKDSFLDFTERFPIVLSSTYSLLHSSHPDFLFDLLIIDEASQVNMASAILSFSKAKRVVVIGDLKQLPEIDEKGLESLEAKLARQFFVSHPYRYVKNNILLSLKELYGDAIPQTLLEEHYRCQKDIIAFSNRRFYDNRLVCFTKDDGLASHLKLIHTVPGNHARRNSEGTGLYNEREIEEVLAEVKKRDPHESVAVITPYRHQADLLRARLPEDIPVDTIHKFQGRECDAVIFSTVANDAADYYRGEEVVHSFVNNSELLNVALTRAKHHFTLITSDKIYHSAKGFLGDLIRYMVYETDSDECQGKIKSIFDILYSDYAEAQKALLKGKNSQAELSELALRDLLDKILKDKTYASLRYAEHVNLSSLIPIDSKSYDSEQYRYLTHPWTHVDFALYNIYDRKPVLLIEVDGVAYHEQKEKQRRHDALKDQAIAASGLTLLRLKSNGSQEESQIRLALASEV